MRKGLLATKLKMEHTKEKNIKHQTRDIIRQVKEGEQKAQFQLYKYYFNTMYKTSLDIVKDEGKAEDVLNEAFLKAFDNIDTYDSQDSFDNWLEDIIVYQSKNKIQKHNTKEENDFHLTSENKLSKAFPNKLKEIFKTNREKLDIFMNKIRRILKH
jgi:RNA polymerase sigma-70 factor (ECF subfamily)